MSMEDLEPLSPSEAARVLSEQRWGRNEEREQTPPTPPASGGEGYGKEGVERGQGFEPMKLANPIPKPDDTPIDSSDFLRQEGPTTEPVPISYNHQGGSRHGEPMPENQTVPLEQAAHDLTRHREAIAQSEQAQVEAEIARAIDQLRSGDAQQQQPAPEAQQTPQAQQPETPQSAEAPPPGVDPEVWQAIRTNPKLLHTLAELQQQSVNAVGYAEQEATRQVEQARQAYDQGLRQNSELLVAHISARHPELRVPMQNWPAVIESLQQSNPRRAQEISAELHNTRALFTQAAAAESARQQAAALQQQQAWQNAAADADARYDEFSRQFTAEQNAETRQEALAYLKQELGLNEKQIAAAWTTGALRSYEAQRLLHDAARYRMLQRGLAEKKVTSAPPVQRPSSPLERGSEQDYDMRKLESRLNETGSPKDAARLLAARRARR